LEYVYGNQVEERREVTEKGGECLGRFASRSTLRGGVCVYLVVGIV
jgi:hypothetical protein